MQIGIKPSVDIVFIKIFGSIDHKDLSLHFLNELLPLAGREPVSLPNPRGLTHGLANALRQAGPPASNAKPLELHAPEAFLPWSEFSQPSRGVGSQGPLAPRSP